MSKRDKLESPNGKYLGDDPSLLPDNPAIKFPDLPNTHCCICGEEIVVQIYKNTGVCCELHRKDRDNDHQPARIGYSSGS